MRRTVAASSAAMLTALWFLAGLVWVPAASAQVTGSNLLEVQAGNEPFADPPDRFDLYDRLDLSYSTRQIRLGVRFETNRYSTTDPNFDFTYEELTQRYAEWSDDGLRIRVGNFYTILGRGLVHRSFDLTGVVLDQPGLRSRYAPSRDVDGVLVEGSAGPVSGLFFGGAPNGGEVSPGTESAGLSRYSGDLVGGEFAVRPIANSRVGLTYARFAANGDDRQYGSGFLEVDPFHFVDGVEVSLPLYVEYAAQGTTFEDGLSLTTDAKEPHALYASANLLWRFVGLSAEWKDYSQFRNGFSDPPSLVREHTWALLNRETHVLDADREKGFQLEGSVSRPELGAITVNLSRSDGNFGTSAARFEELYVEAHVAPDYGERWEATVFFDKGKDEFLFVDAREAYGGSATYRFTPDYSASLDFQRQPVDAGPVSYSDTYLSGSFAWANRATVAVVYEWTNDPFEEDPDEFFEPGIKPHHYLGLNVRTQIRRDHELQVFLGERRGGNACTAGTCYEVLSFKGLEVRLTSLF